MKITKIWKLLFCLTPVALAAPFLLLVPSCTENDNFIVDTNFILDSVTNAKNNESVSSSTYVDFFENLTLKQKTTELCYDLFGFLNTEKLETKDGEKETFIDFFLDQTKPQSISFQARISNYSLVLNDQGKLTGTFLGYLKCIFLNDNYKNYPKGSYIMWTYDFSDIVVAVDENDFSLTYATSETTNIIGIKRESINSGSSAIVSVTTTGYKPKNYFNIIK